MVDQSVVKIIHNYIAKAAQSGVNISHAYLFGSYAQGREDPDSDLDLLVVCPDLTEQTREETVNRLWELRLQTDSRIEPIAITREAWTSGKGGIIVDLAQNHGIQIL